MRSKAVIFDLDGTLYDKKRLALRMVLRDPAHIRLMRCERSARHSYAGRPFGSKESFYDSFLSCIAQMSGRRVKYVEKWYFGTYMQNMVSILQRRYSARPWVRKELASLRQAGVKVALLSDYGFVREKLQAVGIAAGWFDVIADAPSCGGLKPCRETFLKVAGELHESPEIILMVGDRQDTDGAGAAACGMQFVHIDRYLERKNEF